jgi:DNA mismatch endonuclease (patch repair protein)
LRIPIRSVIIKKFIRRLFDIFDTAVERILTVDSLSPAERSERMSRVRSKDSKPELAVRQLVHAMGFRYRLHVGKLPGKPDLVFPARKKVIFVHGCFWHRHGLNCRLTRWPKSKLEFWKPKLESNHERDKKHRRSLRRLGWRVLTIWECEIPKTERLEARIKKFLSEV